MIRQTIFELFNDPIYKFIAIIALIQIAMIVLAILWLLVPYVVRQHRTAVKNRFNTQLGNSFLYDIEDDAKLDDWISRAKKYPSYILYDFINQYFYYYTQDHPLFPKILYVYEKLGLLRRDVQAMNSKIWHRRIMAIRRLMNVASEREKRTFERCRTDRQMIKIIALQVLGRIGNAGDIFTMIEDHIIDNRLMEQPFFVLFNSLEMETFEALMERWNEIQCPRMRQVMLICCAKRDSAFAKPWLVEAARSEDMEMRIAFCKAAAAAEDDELQDRLRKATGDPAWEVRSQAARSLGQIEDEDESPEDRQVTVDLLKKLLEEREDSFWVRQSAAFSLWRKGVLGQEALEEIQREGQDKYGVDAATQELERIRTDEYLS